MFQDWINLHLHALFFGHAILPARPIGHEKKTGTQKSKSMCTSDRETSTVMAKIYETNFSVSMKWGKIQFQFLNSFLLVLTKPSFWKEDWALGYYEDLRL